MQETEYAVIGGGLVGMAIAHGLHNRGRQVTVFDEGDDALRASRTDTKTRGTSGLATSRVEG